MTPTVDDRPLKRPNLAHLALLVAWVALVIDAWGAIGDNSFLWHIRAGQLQAQAAEVLVADPFSFTAAGAPWRTQSWLVELLYAWIEPVAEPIFAAPLMLVMSTLTVLTIGVVAYRLSRSVVSTLVVTLLTTVLMMRFFVPRPALFSYPLFALVILGWERRSTRWALPVLFWIWAAVHGSFVVGLAYVGLRIVASRDWRALPHLMVAGLATLLTAHGIGIVETLLEFGSAGEYLSLVSEWRTPDLLEAGLLPVLAGIGLMFYGATKGRLRAADLWILLPFLALAFSAERAVGTAWIALTPLMARSVTARTDRLRAFSPPVAAIALVVILTTPFFLIDRVALDAEAFPVAAAEELSNAPTFHDDYAGGYLIWAMGPDWPVYIDDRVELYGERIEEFTDVRAGRVDWEPVFARDGIEQVLLGVDEPLVDVLQDAGWVTRYQDEGFVILRPPS